MLSLVSASAGGTTLFFSFHHMKPSRRRRNFRAYRLFFEPSAVPVPLQSFLLPSFVAEFVGGLHEPTLLVVRDVRRRFLLPLPGGGVFGFHVGRPAWIPNGSGYFFLLEHVENAWLGLDVATAARASVASGDWVVDVVVVGDPLLLVLASHYDMSSRWWGRTGLCYNLIDGAAWLSSHSAMPVCGPKGAPSIPLLRPKSTPNTYGVSLWNPILIAWFLTNLLKPARSGDHNVNPQHRGFFEPSI